MASMTKAGWAMMNDRRWVTMLDESCTARWLRLLDERCTARWLQLLDERCTARWLQLSDERQDDVLEVLSVMNDLEKENSARGVKTFAGDGEFYQVVELACVIVEHETKAEAMAFVREFMDDDDFRGHGKVT
jgi:hypothetical protein